MGTDVLSKDHPLIEGPRTHRTGIRLFTCMNPLMLPQCPAIGERLPTIPTPVRTLARMNSHMNLLRTPRPESLATLIARKQLARSVYAMRVAVIRQRSSVGKFLMTDIANNRFIAMRCHVTLQTRLIVEILATFRARMAFFTRMVPGVFHEGFPIATLFATEDTRIRSHLSRMQVR